MTSGRLLALAVVVAVAAMWWASGLGRDPVNPRRFFTEEQIERADAYRGPRYAGLVAGAAIDLALLGLLAFTAVGDRLLSPMRSWPWVLGAAGAAAAVVAARAVARLPVSFWLGHVHERRWGFSTQSAGGWLGDWGKGVAISAVLAAVVLVGLVGLARWLPRAWPAAAAGGAVALMVALSFLWPVLVEPVFNRFEPLRDAEAAREYRALARRAGVPVREVLVADASRRTTKENAYVSGLGGTRRLVLYDTLLERADPPEVRLVVAHELGHRRLGHLERGTAIAAVGAAATVAVLWLLLRADGVLAAARSAGVADPRVAPLILLVVAVMTLATAPPANWISRRFEEAADRFALELTADPETYMRTERELALSNLSDLDPGPVAYRFLFTHPTPAERIGYALEGPEAPASEALDAPKASEAPGAPERSEAPGAPE